MNAANNPVFPDIKWATSKGGVTITFHHPLATADQKPQAQLSDDHSTLLFRAAVALQPSNTAPGGAVQSTGGALASHYEASIELFESVESLSCATSGAETVVTLAKRRATSSSDKPRDEAEYRVWPRLTAARGRHPRIKVDWALMEDSDDENESKTTSTPDISFNNKYLPESIRHIDANNPSPEDLATLRREMSKPENRKLLQAMRDAADTQAPHDPNVFTKLLKGATAKERGSMAYVSFVNFVCLMGTVCVLGFFLAELVQGWLWGDFRVLGSPWTRAPTDGKFALSSLVKATLEETWQHVYKFTMAIQLGGLLEILNAFLGISQGNLLAVILLQVGRNIIMLGVLVPNWGGIALWSVDGSSNRWDGVQNHWTAGLLCLVWAMGDAVRFLYYIDSALKQTIGSPTPEPTTTTATTTAPKPSFLKRLRQFTPVALLPVGFWAEMCLVWLCYPLANYGIAGVIPSWYEPIASVARAISPVLIAECTGASCAVAATPLAHIILGYSVLAYGLGAPFLYFHVIRKLCKRRKPKQA